MKFQIQRESFQIFINHMLPALVIQRSHRRRKARRILETILSVVFLFSQASFAAPAVFEDFSGTMSEQKFDSTEKSMTVESGEFFLTSRAKSYLRKNSGNSAFLINSNDVKNYSADLKVIDLSLGNSNTQQAILRLQGNYYYTEVGLAFVSIAIGDRGNGLEAWYDIFNNTNDANGQFVSSESFAQGSLALDGLSLNTAYRASIEYDGDNGFTFQFNNGIPVSVSGPIKTGDSPFWRGAGTRLRFGQNNATPSIYEDERPEDGSTAFIKGSVDNVATEMTGIGDDFSSENLDKWNKLPNSTLITANGQLEMSIAQTGNSRVTQRVSLGQQGLKYIGAKVTLLSKSTPSEFARVRARIIHYVGNDTFDANNGDTYNRFEGDIFTQITIERKEDGSFRIFAYISRASDADFNSEEEILFQEITPITPVAYDVQYGLAIEQVDKTVNFIIDGETAVSFDLSTSDVFSGNLYSASGTSSTQLNARIQNGPGRVVALFDDVTTDLIPSNVSLNGTNSDNENVALPEEVIVNVGELVTLIADTTNPDDIIRYVWEQISGTSVDIPVASGRSSSIVSASAKVVGNESTLSFTVPAGSDTEELAFKLTTVNKSGLENVEPFSLKVDNSRESTLSPSIVITEPTEPTTSSGGGSFNLLFLFMLLLMKTARGAARRHSR